ncbi:hypothetical protein ACHAXR_002662 [Thalassiosira sp. AJA248-18]
MKSTPHRRHHRLSFVCVNDVYSFDDLDSAASPRGGWSRAATLMKKLLGQNQNNGHESCEETILTVVNGDVLGGCSLLQYSQGSVAIEVMNAIPINIAVLGNHEFDYGEKALIQRVKESNFDWLGSNVYYPLQSSSDMDIPFQEKVDSGLQQKQTLHYLPGIHGNGKIFSLSNNLKLGVFGLVTKLTPTISNPSEQVVFDHDIISVARRTTQSLRKQGAHVIVAITHLSEAEDLLLAEDKVSGVDLILGGHEHEPLAKMVHRNEDAVAEEPDNGEILDGGEDSKHNEGGVLVFKCGMNAYWVGKVDLDIDQVNQNGTGTSISTSWSMHAVTCSTAEDSTVSEIVKRCRKKTDESSMISSFGKEIAAAISFDDLIATIGETTNPLDTRMSSVRRREATGGNWVADAMHWLLETNLNIESSLPMLAMINGGFIRGDRLYKSGSKITAREILKELPFPRTMKVLEITGINLRAAMVEQLKGSTKGPTGAYPHVSSNVRFRYQLLGSASDADSGGEGFSIRSFNVNGLEVSDTQKYIIAVTSFVADGNEGCSSWLKSTRIKNPAWEDVNLSGVLLKYLQMHSVVHPVLEDRVILA